MASALELYPSDADLWLEFGGSYTGLTPNNVLVDGDMEAVGTPAWGVYRNATISKQLGSPYAGLKCLRVAYSNMSYPAASQAVVTSGRRYLITGWMRSSGARAPYIGFGASADYQGTTSTSWQRIHWDVVADGNIVVFGMASTAAVGEYVEFDNLSVRPYGNVIDNLAERGGAPSLVICGDGITANTIPGQPTNGKRGAAFTGTQWIDTGIIDRFERTDKFTLFSVTSGASFGDIMCTYDQAQNYKGFGYQLTTAETLSTFLINTTAGNWISKSSVLSGRSATSVAIVNNGLSNSASVDIYINGRLNSTTVQDSLSATIKNGKPLLLGARHNGASKTVFLIGNMHFAAVVPLAASQLQIANLHKRVMRRINLP